MAMAHRELPVNDRYAQEAEDRWGDTDAFRQSKQRTVAYTPDDWERINTEADDISAAFVSLMSTGAPPDSEQARALAERHRRHISTWFYDCPAALHAGLGRLYVTDQRFTDSIDKAGTGLAAYMAAAFAANAGD